MLCMYNEHSSISFLQILPYMSCYYPIEKNTSLKKAYIKQMKLGIQCTKNMLDT